MYFNNKVYYKNFHQLRLRKTIDFIGDSFYIKNENVSSLDIGSYEGEFGELLKQKFPKMEIYLSDLKYPQNNNILKKFNYVLLGNLNEESLPFPSNKFDLVTCLEVIEHLYNPDNIISEIYRVLKPTGMLILSTPNLSALTNRLLLLFGYYPLSLSISYTSELTGHRDIFKKHSKKQEEAIFDYHIRGYTPKALKLILYLNNFLVCETELINCYRSRMYPVYKIVEKILPSLSQTILIKAKPKKI